MSAECVWVPDHNARLARRPTGRYCRMRGCMEPVVWELLRRNGWWGYCSEHTYGRRLDPPSNRVLCLVAADSPAAERGYV